MLPYYIHTRSVTVLESNCLIVCSGKNWQRTYTTANTTHHSTLSRHCNCNCNCNCPRGCSVGWIVLRWYRTLLYSIHIVGVLGTRMNVNDVLEEDIINCIKYREQLIKKGHDLVAITVSKKSSQNGITARELVNLASQLREHGIRLTYYYCLFLMYY